MIVAKSKNDVIGIDGKLPWHNSDDLRFFKNVTYRQYVIMGRKTVESLPDNGLPNRDVLCLTRNKEWKDPRCYMYFHDIKDLLKFIENQRLEPFYVAGGSEVYEQLLPYCEEQIITEVDEIVDTNNPDKKFSFYPENYSDGFKISRTHELNEYSKVIYLKIVK